MKHAPANKAELATATALLCCNGIPPHSPAFVVTPEEHWLPVVMHALEPLHQLQPTDRLCAVLAHEKQSVMVEHCSKKTLERIFR